MPIKKVKGGYKVANTKSKPMPKKQAVKQQKAIYASKAKKRGRGGKG